MTPQLILIILLAGIVVILIGVALRLAKTVEQQRRRISELEGSGVLTDKTPSND